MTETLTTTTTYGLDPLDVVIETHGDSIEAHVTISHTARMSMLRDLTRSLAHQQALMLLVLLGRTPIANPQHQAILDDVLRRLPESTWTFTLTGEQAERVVEELDQDPPLCESPRCDSFAMRDLTEREPHWFSYCGTHMERGY